MDYDLFESRALEIFYKTDERLTAQLAAYRIGCTVSQARAFLDAMAANGVVELESDERGALYFDLPGRPAASGLPLSWAVGTGQNAQIQASRPGVAVPHEASQRHSMAAQSYPNPPGYALQPMPMPQPQWNVPQGHVQATHIQIHNNMPAMVFVGQDKSVGTAVVLAFLFGPLGMLYSTIAGALIMMFVGGVIMVATLGLGIVLVVPICMIWAGMSASSHNTRLRAQTMAGISRR